jgi:large subunit ribosomal protein L10
MSKPVKDMMVAEYRRRFGELEAAVVIEIRGLDAEGTTSLRGDLREKAIRVSIVKNTLARKAFAGTPLEALDPSLEGPSALVYGGASVVDVARELVAKAKKVKQLELKAACLDGVLYEGAEGVTRLSTMPTREEAQTELVTLALSPGRNLLGAAKGPGGRLLGIVKEIQERLERGETISKAS